MRVFPACLIVGLFLSSPVLAGFLPINSTPDIAVGASSTANVHIEGTANWIFIQNDCAGDLYFRLAPGKPDDDGGGTSYPLRLATDESFSGELVVHNLLASNSTSSACTFTLIIAR